MRVLIVDDTKIQLMALKAAVLAGGYDVETASNGVEAMEVMHHSPCRLVISDWEMPQMNGLELCQAIRTTDLAGYVYIILLTSHDTPEEAVQGLSAGADDFVRKPFHAAELIARLRAAERVLSLETREVAIFAMAKLAESRDLETGAHLERVQRYSRALALNLANLPQFSQELNAEYARLIYLTSPLHDIGKVGIPDCVLLKPGRLSEHEFEIMKTHTTLGAQTLDAALKRFPDVKFLRMARDIAATHHERFDGTGYPGGLAGNAIPLCGRIVALADVYDALTSKRVYKEAFTHEIAKNMIQRERGTQFDPAIVDAFLSIEAEFLRIRSEYTNVRVAA